MDNTYQKGFVSVVAVIAILIIVGIGGYVIWCNYQPTDTSPDTSTSTNPTSTPSSVPTSTSAKKPAPKPAPTPVIASSGIQGSVLISPVCPVETYPPDPSCAPKPYATKLVVTTGDQSRIVKEFSSDANGTFKVDVPPGEYDVHSASTSELGGGCAVSNTVKVSQGSYTKVTVNCDSGIR